MSVTTLPLAQEDLWDAWERVQENAGCAGSDGVTVEQFSRHAARLLTRLLQRVQRHEYRPFPLLKIVVEKHPLTPGNQKSKIKSQKSKLTPTEMPDSTPENVPENAPENVVAPAAALPARRGQGTRTLLVPSVGDRVLETAVARYLSRSFEEEFLECSFGYRPGRSVDRAIARIRKCRTMGYQFVVDADIEAFFDRVDHALLLARLAERRPPAAIMDLLRLWVERHVWDGAHVRRLKRGVPQGSPISPLLANFFLEDFDRELEKSGRKLVRYADDFLILAQTQDDAQQALTQVESLLAAAHLDLNREKTRIVDFQHGFRFLGALFEGEGIWVPWKNDRAKGRLLFMARPMPLSLRQQYELPPPRNALQAAVARAESAGLAPAAVQASQQRLPRSQPVAFLYLTEQGSILRKAGDRLLVEKDDEVILDIPYHKLESVLLFGSIQVTTQALGELLEKGVHLSLFSRQGGFRGSLVPPRGKNIELRLAQFRASGAGFQPAQAVGEAEPGKLKTCPTALTIARAIVAAKIANGLAVLDRYRARNPVPEGWEQARQSMEQSIGAVQAAGDIATLDGVEGSAARAYFGALMAFNRSPFVWPGRLKHPATDPLNAMLSLTYTLLMNEFTALLEGAGLDPYLGFLHQVDYGRPSLALDMMEPFRHPVADRFVLTMVNRAIFDSTDFRDRGDQPGTFLASGAMKRYLAEYERWMLARPSRFREVLRTEVERLVVALREGADFEPFRFDAATDPLDADGPAGEVKSQEVAMLACAAGSSPEGPETRAEAPDSSFSEVSD